MKSFAVAALAAFTLPSLGGCTQDRQTGGGTVRRTAMVLQKRMSEHQKSAVDVLENVTATAAPQSESRALGRTTHRHGFRW